MRLPIASGKGGTGKTTVAVNLALVAEDPVRFLDCDVEEPNAHIFLKPEFEISELIGVPVPVVDEGKCNGCGLCGEVCQFKAIVSLKTKPLTFPELCHGCGGCALFCPEGAITESPREVGVLERGHAGAIEFVHGRLRVGEAMSPPLIRAVKKAKRVAGDLTLIDAPPGISCPVVEAVRGADYVLLVTEPTPFGLHDLKLAMDMIRELGLPFGVVLNRAGIGDDRVHEYCEQEGIAMLLEVPDDRRVAEAYFRGRTAVEALPEYRDLFARLLMRLQAEARA